MLMHTAATIADRRNVSRLDGQTTFLSSLITSPIAANRDFFLGLAACG